MGIIDRDELCAAFHQRCNEGHVARQSIKLSDHQDCSLAATLFECGGQLGPVVLPPALDLYKLC